MKKLTVILALVLAVAVVGCKKNEKAGTPVEASKPEAVQLSDTEFGVTTLALVDKGEYKMSCEDSVHLLSLITAVGADFEANPTANATDNMTPAMKDFELKMDSFGDALESRFPNDNETLGTVLDKLGTDLSKVFQISIMQSVGMLDDTGVKNYIDYTFCGVTPPTDYVDPLAQMEQELNNSMIQDNSTTQP